MMQKEMPRRYWKNLPEAVLIQPLTALAAERSGRMIEQDASEPRRRRPAASLALRLDQRASANDALHGVAHTEFAAASDLARSPEHEAEGIGTGRSEPGRTGTVFPPIVPIDLFRAADPTALAAATERCRACPIGQHATQAVSGEGPVGARLMLVGEQPGDQEDLRGRPFVGPAGQLLDRAFKKLGWARNTLYLTNAVKHFKYELRGQRRIHKTASQREAAACAHWLEAEIALIRPQAVIALGATAARALMGRHVAVTSERGQWLVREDGLRVLVTLHPAALLRMDPSVFDVGYDDWLRDLAHASAHAAEPAMARAPAARVGEPSP
jgi:DNA polymerase